MKKTIVLVTLITLFSFGTGVFAQEAELPNPGLAPDSPFYFLERIVEEIGTFFTFGDLKKAERYATLAAERLAEAQAVVEKGKPEFAEKILERYEIQLNKSITRAEKAQARGQNTEKVMEVVAKVGKATSIHLEILAEVYEKVPEQAKPAIEQAMKVSVKGHEKAVEALKAKNALGSVPEEAPLPEKIPQEVRERVQTRVQQELEIEKSLEGVDMSKSLKDICAEQGGTPEMCEQFPDKKFKSFKEIEDYCIGLGGQADVCSTLEQKCREFGVTTPNECFIMLSVSSIKAYQSAEFKAVPARPLSEEEMEERKRIEEEIRMRQPRMSEEEMEARGRIEEETRTGYVFLGVQYQIINKKVQEARNLPVDYGVLLRGEPAIVPDSPAALAGLKEGDIILEFQDERITEDNSLTKMLSRRKAGEVVSLKVLRGEEVIIIKVELVERLEEELNKRIQEKIREELECKFNEIIFYYSDTCGHCQKVKDEGTIGKIEELGVKVNRVDVTIGPIQHQFSGVPTFVIDEKVYIGYKTYEQLKELLGCR